MKESDIMGVIEGRSTPQEGRLTGPSQFNPANLMSNGVRNMAAKEVKFSGEAREKMLRGVDIARQCGEE